MEDALKDGEVDPLADPTSEAEPQEVEEAEGATPDEEGQPQEPAAEEGIPGTPFKDVNGLVKSYKEIQRLAEQRRTELEQAKQYVYQMAQMLQQRQPAAQEPQKQEEDFWQRFASSPEQVLQQLLERQLSERVGPIQSEFAKYRTDKEVDTWFANHKDLTEEQEVQIVDIMRSNPWLRNIPNRLDVAYDMMMARTYRDTQQKSRATAAVAGAKQTAGLGGKKSALAQPAERDAFDDVLDMDKAQRELYRMGRK